MRRTLVAGLASVALVAASLMGAGAATAAPSATAVTPTLGAGSAAPVFWCLTFGYFCPKTKCRDNWCSR